MQTLNKQPERSVEEIRKNLHIISIVDDTVFGRAALAHAFTFARIFNASLSVIEPYKENISISISEYISELNKVYPTDKKTNIIFPKINCKPNNSYFKYAEETNTIIIVMGASRTKGETLFTHKSALKFIQKSRIPCVLCGKTLPNENAYKNILLPLDALRPSKEKSLWAGYFSRFYKSTVHIITATQKDEYFKTRLSRTLDFTLKLYANLEIDYKIHEVGKIEKEIDEFALEFSPNINGSLLVLTTTRFFTIIDYILGPAELKIISNKEDIPVMCLNQRDDLYVLCT